MGHPHHRVRRVEPHLRHRHAGRDRPNKQAIVTASPPAAPTTATAPEPPAPAVTNTVSRTLSRSRYGPVATGWTNTTAFAVDDANADNLRSVNEWLAMAKSENIAQLRTAQDTYQGLPWLYTLASDSSGTVYFADASVVPHVTAAEEKRCAAGQSMDGSTILDGSTSSCGWGSDPDAIEPGIFGPGSHPQLTRTDDA